MSVKKKVKRLNKEVTYLNEKIEDIMHDKAVEQRLHKRREKELENLIKFFIINQVGKHAEGGVHIEKKYIDEIKSLEIDVWYEVENDAYVIKFKEDK